MMRIMENKMEKNIVDEMEAGIAQACVSVGILCRGQNESNMVWV